MVCQEAMCVFMTLSCVLLITEGADQDHKTDEMHTALMEACMDGHVEVARLLLDHGAQVRTWNCILTVGLLYLSK